MTSQSLKVWSSVPSKIETQLDFILLDASGSMTTKWGDMLDAIDTYVNGLRDRKLNSQLMLSTFEGQTAEWIQRDVPINDWFSLHADPVEMGGGGTPLYDAINLMCRRLQVMDPPRCSIVIVTDGDENGSRVTNHTQAKALLTWARAKGWQVTFIGCDFNNSKQADLLGGNPAAAIGVAKARLKDAMLALSGKREKYGLYGSDMHFSGDEKEQFGGYLAKPEGN